MMEQYTKDHFSLPEDFPVNRSLTPGTKKAQENDRHLWPQMFRIIRESRPCWILGENVAGIINMELDTIITDLENIDYSCWPIVIPACSIDAPHERARVWIIAHTSEVDVQRMWATRLKESQCPLLKIILDSCSTGDGTAIWSSEPSIHRVDDGIFATVDRNDALGNAIVPQVAEVIIRNMMRTTYAMGT
jgi:DNA (cytosine-5)-methyltransferase 1